MQLHGNVLVISSPRYRFALPTASKHAFLSHTTVVGQIYTDYSNIKDIRLSLQEVDNLKHKQVRDIM